MDSSGSPPVFFIQCVHFLSFEGSHVSWCISPFCSVGADGKDEHHPVVAGFGGDDAGGRGVGELEGNVIAGSGADSIGDVSGVECNGEIVAVLQAVHGFVNAARFGLRREVQRVLGNGETDKVILSFPGHDACPIQSGGEGCFIHTDGHGEVLGDNALVIDIFSGEQGACHLDACETELGCTVIDGDGDRFVRVREDTGKIGQGLAGNDSGERIGAILLGRCDGRETEAVQGNEGHGIGGYFHECTGENDTGLIRCDGGQNMSDHVFQGEGRDCYSVGGIHGAGHGILTGEKGETGTGLVVGNEGGLIIRFDGSEGVWNLVEKLGEEFTLNDCLSGF